MKTLKQLIKKINPDYQYFYSDFKDSKEKRDNREIELVKLDKWMTNEEVIKFMDDKGLEPCSFHALAQFILDNPKVWDKKKYLLTLRDKNEYLAFGRWGDERDVYCNRRDDGWDDSFWFAGVRKGSLPLASLGVPLEFGTLTLTINGNSYKFKQIKGN